MKKIDQKITKSIQQDPAYDCLDGLGHDVWKQIRQTKKSHNTGSWFDFTLTPAIRALSLVLFLGSCLALSQISFDTGLNPDLFDLRYFSHQSLATTNLLSMNDQGIFR